MFEKVSKNLWFSTTDIFTGHFQSSHSKEQLLASPSLLLSSVKSNVYSIKILGKTFIDVN